jgi:hypothetical protein
LWEHFAGGDDDDDNGVIVAIKKADSNFYEGGSGFASAV